MYMLSAFVQSRTSSMSLILFGIVVLAIIAVLIWLTMTDPEKKRRAK